MYLIYGGKNSTYNWGKHQWIEIDPDMQNMLKLANKNSETIILKVLKNLMERMDTMSE